MEPVYLAGIAFLQLVALTVITQWGKSRDKKEDWARQDAVAAKVETAAREVVARAKLLEEAQAETIARTDKVATVAAAADARVQASLKVIDESTQKIHKLVNSDMTAAREAERKAVEETIAELLAQQATAPTPERAKRIAVKQKRVVELTQILADRLAAQKAVDAQSVTDRLVDK